MTLHRQLMSPRLDPGARVARIGIIALSVTLLGLAGVHRLVAAPNLLGDGSPGHAFELASIVILALAVIGARVGVEVAMAELEQRRRAAGWRRPPVVARRRAVLGTLVGATVAVVSSAALCWWVAGVDDYRGPYGVVGGALVVVLWVHLASLAVLIAGLVTSKLR